MKLLHGVVVLAVVAAPGTSHAEDPGAPSNESPPAAPSGEVQSRDAFERGQAAYARKDFGGAATLFQRAYELFPAPAFLYNMAQAERLEGDCDAALIHYRQFVATYAGPMPADMDEKLADVKRCVSEPSPPRPSETPKERTPEAAPSVAPRPEEEPRLPRWATWTAVGVGAAGVVAGTVTAVMVAHRQAVVEQLCPGKVCRDASGLDAASEGKALLVGSVAAYAVGAAGLGFGVYFLTEGSRAHPEGSRARTDMPAGAVLTWSAAL